MSRRKQEIDDYIRDKKIKELFNHLCGLLLFFKPDDPTAFMCNVLLDMNDAKEKNEAISLMYSDESLKAYFRLLDPANTGFITRGQLRSALMVLGATGASCPEWVQDRVDVETFVDVSKQELQKVLKE